MLYFPNLQLEIYLVQSLLEFMLSYIYKLQQLFTKSLLLKRLKYIEIYIMAEILCKQKYQKVRINTG